MKSFNMLLLMAVMLFQSIIIFAQAKPASTMIDKKNRDAVMIEINQPVNITTDALQQKLQREGLTEKIKNGIGSYKGVTLAEISNDKIDLYTKVEEGPNNSSDVYMAVSKGYNNFTNSGADSIITLKIETFLNSFVIDANNQYADVNISNQIKAENESEKEYQQLLDEQKDLEKKKDKIDNRLNEIQNEMGKKQIEIDKIKTEIEDSKTNRSNANNQ